MLTNSLNLQFFLSEKGRPIGCLSCSELRRTKSIHAKCSCIKEEIDSG